MAQMAQEQGKLEAAEGVLRRSLLSGPAQPQTWFQLGSVLEDMGRSSEAEVCYARASEFSSAFAQAHYNRARMLHQLGQPARAAECVSQALKHAQGELQVQALQLRALLEDASGALHTALATLDDAIRLAPQRSALHHNRGVLLQRMARAAEALHAIDTALELGLDTPDAHYNRGNSLQSMGLTAQALDAYRMALARNPQHELALFDLARLRWRLGDADYAAELEATAATYPDSHVAFGILGRLLLAGGNPDRAAGAYARAIELSGDSAGYLDGLGQALSRAGLHQKALVAHQRAVQLAPHQATVRAHHASCLLQLGKIDSAAQVAEQAVRADPSDQHAWALLGVAWRANMHDGYRWLNNYEQHIQVYDLAPPPDWGDMASFNLALAAALHQWHTDAKAPIDQSLRHGTQTMENLFDQPHPLVQHLKGLVSRAVDHYIAHLRELRFDETHPLLGRISPKWRFTDSWSSRLLNGGFHTSHVHAHGWISSCYYVAVPRTVAQSQGDQPFGWIRFGQPDLTVPGCNFEPERAVKPQVGRLVLFPSFMWHSTAPFNDTQARLTAAFDVMPAN